MVTMFGCLAIMSSLISLKDVIGNPSFSFSSFSLFKATTSPEGMNQFIYVENVKKKTNFLNTRTKFNIIILI